LTSEDAEVDRVSNQAKHPADSRHPAEGALADQATTLVRMRLAAMAAALIGLSSEAMGRQLAKS
jgi:hypothetical protein